MTRGAKPGQNRFADMQSRNRDYRITRLKNEVLPRIKSYVGKISFSGPTLYCKFCAELYNDDLPINAKKIGYRTIAQRSEYWALIGPLFHRYWDTQGSLEAKKDKLVGELAAHRADKLHAQTERLKKEVEALKAALRNHGASLTSDSEPVRGDQGYIAKFDKVCRALKLVLDASEGMFTVCLDSNKISCAYDDLEPEEGLVPRDLATPFVDWIKAREQVYDAD